MAAPNSYAVSSTRIGLALQAARGTPLAPQYWFPVKAPKYKPDQMENPDETLQGIMAQVTGTLVPGLRFDSHGWDSFPYLDSFPLLVCAELGSTDTKTAAPSSTTMHGAAVAGATSIATHVSIAAGSWVVIGSGGTLETHQTGTPSGVSDPYTIPLTVPLVYPHADTTAVTGLTQHQFSLLNNADATGNQPPALTVSDFDGEEWRQLANCQLDQLTIKGNATGILEYTCTMMGDGATTPSTPTPSYTTATPPPSWSTAALLNSSEVLYIQSWEFDFKRGVKNLPGTTVSQNYYQHFAGPLQAAGKITVIEQSGAPELTDYLTNTVIPFDFTVFDLTNGWAMNLHSTLAQFKATGGIDRSKVEEVTVELDVQFLPSTTDALAGTKSPVLVTVANGVTAQYTNT